MIRGYSDLTIKQFIKCKQISELEDDPILRKVKLLAEVTGRTTEEVETMPLADMMHQLKQLDQLTGMEHSENVDMKFKVKGKRFECIWKVQELTAAQYIDVKHFAKDPNKLTENIHNILAAICVERTWYGKRKPYNGTNHEAIANHLYTHMTINQAYPIMVFFCKFSEALSSAILTYTVEEAQKLKQQITSTQSGATLQSSTS